MKISVIIPMRNAAGTIVDCLVALDLQTVPPDEVIVIENNSTDLSYQVVSSASESLKHINVILISEPGVGAAIARNKGLTVATGSIIAFTDADCIPDINWIKNIKKMLVEYPDLDVIGGVESGNPVASSMVGKMLSRSWISPRSQLRKTIITSKWDFFSGNVIITFNCAVRREILTKINGFDEKFVPAGEDTDMFLRAFDHGARLVTWVPDLVVTHRQDITVRRLVSKMFGYGEAAARLTRRHFYHQIIFRNSRGSYRGWSSSWLTFVTYSRLNISLLSAVAAITILSTPITMEWVGLLGVITSGCLFSVVKKRLQHQTDSVSTSDVVLISCLNMVRKLALEAGLLYGSLRFGVICI